MIPFISNLLNLPVTRKEVLKRAKKHRNFGLCHAIAESLYEYKLSVLSPKECIPEFKFENALCFGANGSVDCYWWKTCDWTGACDWTSGRMDFLNWLIAGYKNDKTNLRKMK